MKNLAIIFLLTLTISFGCRDKKRYNDKGLSEYQIEMNNFFKDASTSPLKRKDLKNFKGLDFFEHSDNYIVKAIIKKTPQSQPFKIETTTERLADFKKYGNIFFTLDEVEYNLSVYKILEYEGKKGYENYLFLPYLDLTNGNETYGGGRYIDLYLEEHDSILLDFNKSYNPKCVYDEIFSCPIVPRDNFLNRKIEAGVKIFYK